MIRQGLVGAALLTCFGLAGCSSAGADPSADAPSDSSDDEVLQAGSADHLNIGFAHGKVDQFDYYSTFFNAGSVQPGPHVCRTFVHYEPWLSPQVPTPDSHSRSGSPNALAAWLAAAALPGVNGKPKCEDVLISFQGDASRYVVPNRRQWARVMTHFLAVDWSQTSGYHGTLSISPLNEPNNGAGAGNGLGRGIAPEVAADLYLAVASACRGGRCTAVAGDFASEPTGWFQNFESNCAKDAQIDQLTHRCGAPSSHNPGNKKLASYLDRYKNHIMRAGTERPKVFAYHGWHDAINFLLNQDHCTSYDTCVTRRVSTAMAGSWSNVAIWDTEVGAVQGQSSLPNGEDLEQAKAQTAAFLLRLHATDTRITRIYYMFLHSGPAWGLVGGSAANPQPYPALDVLRLRNTSP